jgi:hypothetical protein
VDASVFKALLAIQHRKRRLPTRTPTTTTIRRSALVPVPVIESIMTFFCYICFTPAAMVLMLVVVVVVSTTTA